MRLLLDTHALIWWLAGDQSLSADAQAAIIDPAVAFAFIFLAVETHGRAMTLGTEEEEPTASPPLSSSAAW